MKFHLLLLLGAHTIAAAQTLKSVNFNSDPNWEGLNNRAAMPKGVQQDFGYSSDRRIGGAITIAAEPAYYAKKIQPKTLDDTLSASGTLVSDGRGWPLFGFFNADTLKEWRTPNSLAIRLNGRGETFFVHVEYATKRWRINGTGFTVENNSNERIEFKKGSVHRWSLKYDPAGNNGSGAITVTIDDKTSVCPLLEGHKLEGATFNRFGILNAVKHASDKGEMWLGDLTLNGEKQDFGKDPQWEGFQNRHEYETRDMRPNSDYGYSQTHHAGGKAAGEMGGLTFRGNIRLPNNMNYYADRTGLLSLDKSLKASGKICYRRGVTDSATLIGFFHVPVSVTMDPNAPRAPKNWFGYLPKNFFGVAIKGPAREGFYLHPTYRLNDDRGGGNPGGPIPNCPRLNPDDLAHDWSFEYSPSGAGGKGQITVSVDQQSVTMDLAEGHKSAGAQFNRFGIVSNWVDGNGQVVYLDDLIYTVSQE
jgi:hypothetical protein